MESYTEDEGLNTNYVFSFCEDSKGILWIGTDKGLLRFNNRKWKIFDADSGLPGNYITMILPAGKGLLLYISEMGIYHFDDATGKISDNLYEKGSVVEALQRSKVNPAYGIVRYRQNNTKFYEAILLKNPDIKFPLTVKGETLTFIDKGKVTGLGKIQDQLSRFSSVPYRDMVLKAEDQVGIIRYRDGKIFDTISTKNGLGTNLLMQMYRAQSGDVYIGTLGSGFAVLKHRNPKTTFSLQHHKIRNVQYTNGNYYFISSGTLYRTDSKLQTHKIPLRKDALTFCIKEDILSVGAFSGFYQYRMTGDRLTEIKHHPSPTGISAIMPFGGHTLATMYGSGISKDGVPLSTAGFPFTNIENFFKIQKGFAFTSYQSGFFTTDEKFIIKKHYTKADGLLSNYVTVVFQKGTRLFAGTKFGFSVFENNRVVRVYTEKNGFRGNLVRSIFQDVEGNIWVVSDQTIMKLQQNQLVSYGAPKTIGQTEDVIQRSYYNPEKNEIFIASKNKFSLIKLNELRPDRTPPVPQLLSIESKGQTLENQETITLDRDNYNTVFQFESVFKNPVSQAGLFYKINNDRWKAFDGDNLLSISHLDVGSHQLWVKTVNSDGYETYFPKTFRIKVNNYFYHNWWFYVLSLLVFGALVTYFFYQYNVNKFEKKMQQLAIQNELDNERKRISRDLHDNMGAYTTSLIAKVDQLKSENAAEEEKIEDIRQSAGYIMHLLRQTIFVLNSHQDTMENYLDSFHSYCLKFFKTYPEIKFQLTDEITNNRTLDTVAAVNIFRIMQEALQNIVKHSEATEVNLKIISKEKIMLIIQDNGKGFSSNETHNGYGLINMQERAQELGYRLEINSGNWGTVIQLSEI